MKPSVMVQLESYDTLSKTQTLVIESVEDLREAILNLKNNLSSTLSLKAEDDELFVKASDNLFMVSSFINGEFFDLVGDANVSGTVLLTIGGQETKIPKRYLVTMEQLQTPVLNFYKTGTLELENSLWDRTEDSEVWEQEGIVK